MQLDVHYAHQRHCVSSVSMEPISLISMERTNAKDAQKNVKHVMRIKNVLLLNLELGRLQARLWNSLKAACKDIPQTSNFVFRLMKDII